MTVRASSVNPAVLRWARETCGLTLEGAAAETGHAVGTLAAWEAGELAPTYRQLTELAKGSYKRPVAVFFFPAPPLELEIASEFRTLPDEELEKMSPDTLYALREAKARQLSIPNLESGLDIPRRGSIADLRVSRGQTEHELAQQVRDALGISVIEQRTLKSNEDALKRWRAAVEQFGVFVFKRPFEQKRLSGFALDDEKYPVIVLNNSTSHTRQIFTLAHELGHLCFRVSGVTTREQEYLGSLGLDERRIELACNRFAAELLLPTADFPWAEFSGGITQANISTVAKRFHVSREVVLRRLKDTGAVSAGEYDALVTGWNSDYLRSPSAHPGGSYYANIGTWLSQAYVRAAFSQYHRGRLSVGDLADHFNIKGANVEKFEAFFLGKGVAE